MFNYETEVLRFCFILCTLHSKLQFYSSAVCRSKVCLFPVNRIKICNQTCESICVSVKEVCKQIGTQRKRELRGTD